MKIALLADTHAGARNDSRVFRQFQTRFYTEIFFPYLKNHNIWQIIHLGDFFDKRTSINFETLDLVRRNFLERLSVCLNNDITKNIRMDLILGNHDVYYKNLNTLNAPEQLLASVPALTIVTHPCVAHYDGMDIAMVPWICPENETICRRFIETTYAKVLMGHFAINGFDMGGGRIMETGMNPDFFKKYDAVYSGHFHKKSSNGNIHYLGAPVATKWDEYGDPKGFHVLDTKTGDVEFILNPLTAFIKLEYDDTDQMFLEEAFKADYSSIWDSYVRVTVKKRTKPRLFEQWKELLEKENPADLSFIETILRSDDADGYQVDLSKDNFTLMSDWIDTLQVGCKPELKDYVRSLMIKAAEVVV